MQLRVLQTMAEVAEEQNSTLIFPLPMELLRALDAQLPPGKIRRSDRLHTTPTSSSVTTHASPPTSTGSDNSVVKGFLQSAFPPTRSEGVVSVGDRRCGHAMGYRS